MPGRDFVYKGPAHEGRPLQPIPYKPLNLDDPWEKFDIS